ncbi:MAG: AAA family ATPase [Candidatus Aenigmatarchaeota archaeon]
MQMQNKNFRIDNETWRLFLSKYHRKASERIRQLIKADLEALQEIPKVNRNDIEALKKFIFSDNNPIQVVGQVGIGKTTCMKKIIENDSGHIFVVFDCHDEYNLPEIQTITTDLKQSCRIKMPKQVSASRGLYPVYHNQILSQKYPENYVVVIEEAHRYPQVKELLKEARKFVKVIAICQEPLGNFCPRIEVVK